MNLTKNTAVLVFARSAKADMQHKKFVTGERLFDALTQETLRKVRRSKLPYFHSTEAEQEGNTFGDRFVNAIQAVYDQGYTNVITIGNDSPQLKTKHLLEAYEQLQQGNTVLGPTYDGGFYLMGLHKSKFDPQVFLRLPWQRFGLLHSISKVLEGSSSGIFSLPTFTELDSLRDLETLGNFIQSIPQHLLVLVRQFLAKKYTLFSVILEGPISGHLQTFKNKGSPSFLGIA